MKLQASIPALLAAGLAWGCEAQEGPFTVPPERHRGQTRFDSPMPAPSGRGVPGGGLAGTGGSGAAEGEGSARLVEEGDIVRLDGATIYVLNRYRGLQVVDLADPAHPRLVGQAPFHGEPRELYVRGEQAYVIVSDYWSWQRCEGCEIGFSSFHGSNVHVVDLRNPEAPAVIGSIGVGGEVTDSRLVGDVLYVVTSEHAAYMSPGATSMEEATFVISIDVSDPARVHEVARQSFPRHGWESHIHATTTDLFIASSAYGYFDGQDACPAPGAGGGAGPCTQIVHVDISDPAGEIRVRGRSVIEGHVQDRWAIDLDRDVLRVVASPRPWGATTEGPVVHTLRVGAERLEPLGRVQLQLARPEALMATRFDRDRAYVVTFERRDPLFVVDLSDPSHPRVTAELDTPGWLDHIEPRGDRLVALGHDQDPDTQQWQLQVSLYDVARADAPRLLDRERFGGDWGFVPGSRDDFRKVFRVLDELGLILMPHQRQEQDPLEPWWGRTYGAVQLVDLDPGALTLRGVVRQAGYTERALVLPGTRLAAVSSEVLDVLDITDRDRPRLEGSLELARDVRALVLAGDVAVELVGSFEQRTSGLYVVPARQPNAPVPLGVLELRRPAGSLFSNGSLVYVLSGAAYTGRASPDGQPEVLPPIVSVVDVSDPAAPKLRGELALEDGALALGGCYGARPTGALGAAMPGYVPCGAGQALQVDGTLVAMVRGGYCARWDAMASRCADQVSTEIRVLDLGDPKAPAVASIVYLPEAEGTALHFARGRLLYASHLEPYSLGDGQRARYYLDRIDLTWPTHPVRQPSVNVPGELFGASADGRVIYTGERWYDADPATGITRALLLVHALDLDDAAGLARLRGSVAVAGDAGGVAHAEPHAYAITHQYDGRAGLARADLVAFDLSDPDRLASAAQRVDGDGSYWWFDVAVAGPRLFLSGGLGLAVYSLEAPLSPRFLAFHRAPGYGAGPLVVQGDVAYVVGGYRGVESIPLR